MSGSEDRFGDLRRYGDRGRPRDDVSIFGAVAAKTHRGVHRKQHSFGFGFSAEFAFDPSIRHRKQKRPIAGDDEDLFESRGFRGIGDAREPFRESIFERLFEATFIDLPTTGEFAVGGPFEKFLESRAIDRASQRPDGRADSHGSHRGFESSEKLSRVEVHVRGVLK